MSSQETHSSDGLGIRVTIGICVKNGADIIGEAIESIILQDYPQNLMEIIFVDDGSEDKTLSVVQSYLQKLKMKTTVFHHRWKGLGASRDLVVKHAAGEYIIWVDCDMTLSKDFVAKQVKFMDSNSRAGISKGQYGICSQTNLAGYLENTEFVAAHFNRRKKPNSLPLGTGGAIYRVKAIKQAGGFDHSIRGSGEDVDAERRISKLGWGLVANDPVFYEHRRGNWHSLWKEYFWFGKSGSNRFDGDAGVNIHRLWPPIAVIVEFSRANVAYKLTQCKTVFMLPIHYFFKRAAWVMGLISFLLES